MSIEESCTKTRPPSFRSFLLLGARLGLCVLETPGLGPSIRWSESSILVK